jgi:TolB protein
MKFFFLLFMLTPFIAFTQDFSIVSVGKATIEKENLLIKKPFIYGLKNEQKESIEEIHQIIKNDLLFYKKRFILKSDDYSEVWNKEPPFDKFKEFGLDFVVRSEFASSDLNASEIKYEIKLFSIKSQKLAFEKKGTFKLQDIRKIAHGLSDQIYMAITGKKSIFLSKIIFVSDVTTQGKGKNRKVRKELYKVDFDGVNRKRLTFHEGIVISPAISPQGDKIIYTLIEKGKGKKQMKLFLLDLINKKTKLISDNKGINSGGIFYSNGSEILLTLSEVGNAEIFSKDLVTGKLRRVTQHYASDVDPSINADGTLMTFLSNRAGKAMIYTLDPRGLEKDVVRISYVGQYNATPRFSPDGKEIVFSSWLDNGFDLFKINSSGTGLVRLTKDMGSNESPVFSNDGEFIVFSSQKILSMYEAVQDIVLMDREGEVLGPLVKNFGNCLSPRWAEFYLGD